VPHPFTHAARHRTGTIAGLATLALIASACGSNSTASSSSTTTSSTSSSDTSSSSSAMSSSDSAMSGSTDAMSGSDSAMSGSPEAMSGSDSAMSGSDSAMSGSDGSMSGMSGSDGSMMSGSKAPAGGGDAKTATSATDLGGMDGLVAAANKEGALNVIALPPEWSDYKEVIAGFQKKYPNIKLTSQQPDVSSAEEIAAADTNKGTDKAPDVFDLGTAVTLASLNHFAPYKVAAWADIPDANKEATGLWVNDYTGVMTVGYNPDIVGKDVTSLDDLKAPKLKGLVALNGDPTQANSALLAVVFAGLTNGGSLDDISKGVDYFASLKKAGTLSTTKASGQLIAAGKLAAVFDWSYNQLSATTAGPANGYTWKTFTPKGVTLGSYYNQAINKDAPHPAAARLWEEYLYTAQAQNFWMKGGALPILYDAMKKAGTLDPAAAKNLPQVDGTLQQLSPDQATKANVYVKANWAKAVS